MNDGHPVFTSLTLRQAIVLFVGGTAIAFVYEDLDMNELLLIGFIALVTIGLFIAFKPKRITGSPEEYFRGQNKQYPDKVKEKFTRKVAEVESQIENRRQRGMKDDPRLNEALANLKALRDELEGSR